MSSPLVARLERFAAHLHLGKGALCVLLFVTDHARDQGLPLNASSLRAQSKGQVKGLGRAAVQKILARHDIVQILAKEGGRTSRRSLGTMESYVAFLNGLARNNLADLDTIEAFWITRVRTFLAAKPFRLKPDPNRSLRSVIRDLLDQAAARQRSAPGRTDAGAVLQHLVGAKLACAMAPDSIQHNSHATADAPTERRGDFEMGDTVVHVTTSPGVPVIAECQRNLDDGFHPVLITLPNQVAAAVALAEQAANVDRIDVLDIEQFVVLNLYEWRRFQTGDRRQTLRNLVIKYNEIVEEVETDPGLKVELA